MTNGYELYKGIVHDHQLVHLGRWAHVRCGFIKAGESVPTAARSSDLRATRFVLLIGKLFAAEACSAKWNPERRQHLRARYSTRVLSIIERILVEHRAVASARQGIAVHHRTLAQSGQIRRPRGKVITLSPGYGGNPAFEARLVKTG
jgi:hypothetical protein